MRNESTRDTAQPTSPSFDQGLVAHALEREAPSSNRALRSLKAALVASTLAAFGVPGCTIASDSSAPALMGDPGIEQGLDNGTVGKAEGLAPRLWPLERIDHDAA